MTNLTLEQAIQKFKTIIDGLPLKVLADVYWNVAMDVHKENSTFTLPMLYYIEDSVEKRMGKKGLDLIKKVTDELNRIEKEEDEKYAAEYKKEI